MIPGLKICPLFFGAKNQLWVRGPISPLQNGQLTVRGLVVGGLGGGGEGGGGEAQKSMY